MSHHRPSIHDRLLTRRDFLHRCGMGMGALAFSSLLGQAGFFGGHAQAAVSDLNPLAPKAPPLPGKAKRVIHLFMNGGPSQVDTFDPKPALAKYDGQPLPGPNLATERKTGAALASPFGFKKYGQSGIEVSDLFARTAESIDDICVIRSMHADVPNHEPSLMLMNCGDARQARPSVGSWVLYGLGTENQDLPGFIVMCPRGYSIAESQNWQAGFLPGIYQGTYIDSQHTDIEKLIQHIKNRRVSSRAQRAQLDLLLHLNEEHLERRQREQELETRIQSFELAYRMQAEAGDAFDVGREPQHIRDL